MKIQRPIFVLLIVISMLAGGVLTLLIPNVKNAWESSLFQEAGEKSSVADSLDSALEQSGMTEQQLQKIVTTFNLILSKYYQKVESEELIDGAIEGMVQSLGDPYSTYMDAEQAATFNDTVFQSQFTGVGAEVTMEDGKVTVVAPIKGSPAEQAGVQPKDVIIAVNGESLEGLTLNEAVAKIRGPKGSKAELKIMRGTRGETMEIVVVRDDIDVQTVYSKMLEDDIGYIDIRQFALNTGESFSTHLSDLEEQELKGLVIDLRNNPGGVLSVVVDMVEHFIPEGEVIVQVEDGNGLRQKEISEGGEKHYPVVVIINEGSASASEIMAAALQQSAHMKVIGMPSFGKGTVQQTFDSGGGDGSNVKMTIAKWLTPDGTSINEVGVQPDVKVELPEYYMATVLPKDEELTFDQNSIHVRSVQLMLTALGFDPGRTDGYFSEKTELAVKAFQKVHELNVTGIVDTDTANKLETAYAEKLRAQESDLQLQKALEVLKEELAN